MLLNYWEIIGLLIAGMFTTSFGYVLRDTMIRNDENKKQEQSDPGQESDNND